MSSFFDEQGGTRVCGEAYRGYVAAENPRTTPLIEKRAIYGWTLDNGLAASHIFKAAPLLVSLDLTKQLTI